MCTVVQPNRVHAVHQVRIQFRTCQHAVGLLHFFSPPLSRVAVLASCSLSALRSTSPMGFGNARGLWSVSDHSSWKFWVSPSPLISIWNAFFESLKFTSTVNLRSSEKIFFDIFSPSLLERSRPGACGKNLWFSRDDSFDTIPANPSELLRSLNSSQTSTDIFLCRGPSLPRSAMSPSLELSENEPDALPCIYIPFSPTAVGRLRCSCGL